MKTSRVIIFDTTLRDGEQCPGASMNLREKLEVARQLARLRVDVIEAGFPVISKGDFAAVQTIAKEVDGPIITELGGKEKAETTLAEIWRLLLKQPKGQGGALPTNGCASIFYVKNTSGVLRAVNVNWNDGGWNVNVNSIENPNPWNVGNRVFSRNYCFSLYLGCDGEFFNA